MAKPAVGDVVKLNRGDGPEWGIVVEHGTDQDYVVPLGKGAEGVKFNPAGSEGGGGTYWETED